MLSSRVAHVCLFVLMERAERSHGDDRKQHFAPSTTLGSQGLTTFQRDERQVPGGGAAGPERTPLLFSISGGTLTIRLRAGIVMLFLLGAMHQCCRVSVQLTSRKKPC